jgi:hypothetical protein
MRAGIWFALAFMANSLLVVKTRLGTRFTYD